MPKSQTVEMTPCIAKLPGSKKRVEPHRVRNPLGYMHERASKDGRKRKGKAGRGGKIRADGWSFRCGDYI